MSGTGYTIDNSLSTSETKFFVNHDTRTVVISFRGTQIFSKKGVKDIISDLAIMTGTEKFNRRFKQAERQFEKAERKYPGYKINTTGHSLGGQLATYLARTKGNKVAENVSFSRGSGFAEPFRRRPSQTTDISHGGDLISLGARLSRGKRGSSVVDSSFRWNPLAAHATKDLQVVS